MIQEKPTIYGTKAADVLSKCFTRQKSTEYFGAIATTMTSQRLSIHSVAPSTTVKGEFRGSPILGVWGVR